MGAGRNQAPTKGKGREVGREDVSPDQLAEYMVGYQNGKLEAFEELFAALSVPLRNYLTSLTRDRSWGEDLMQETFLQMHRSRHTYMPGRPVKPWAFGIARHVCLMYRRSAARLAKREGPGPEVPPEIPVAPIAELFPQREDLGQALLDVPEGLRESLLLHHVWGLRSGRSVTCSALANVPPSFERSEACRICGKSSALIGCRHERVSPRRAGGSASSDR